MTLSLAELDTEVTGNPSWLHQLRTRARESLQTHGFPTSRHEDWHFTNPAPFAERMRAAPLASASAVTGWRADVFSFGNETWPRVVFVNGRYAAELSDADRLPAGVRVTTLAAAVREEPATVERYLGQIARWDTPALAFTALNTLRMQDGAVLHVAAGTQVPTPIHVLHLTNDHAADRVCMLRNLFVIDRTASATIIEQFATQSGGRSCTNGVTEVMLDAGATLQHYRVQREGEDAIHYGHVEVRQERDSHYVSFSFVTGAAVARTNIYATLAGEGCGATLNGLYMLDGTQTCDHQTRIVHEAPNCYSREMYQGVLDDASHGVFNGQVYVYPEAQKTDGKQTNNTLLLSDRARIDTKPQLEIFADDVKCTHGATVGRLDEQSAFYMKSRGIGRETTRRLLTYAFAAKVLETIELDALRESLEELTLARFTEGS